MYSFGAGSRGEFDSGTMGGWERPSRGDTAKIDAASPGDPIRDLWQQSMALREQSRQARAVSHELRAISRNIRDNLAQPTRTLTR